MHRLSPESALLVLDALPQLAWMAHGDGFIFWYNRRWHAYTGTTPAEMEGWGWQSVHHPDTLPEVLASWRAAIATKRPFEMEFPLRGADGVYRPFLTQANPVTEADGKVAYWVGTNTDISQQRHLADALRANEETFRATFENAAVGIAHISPEGRFVRVNATLCRITGYSATELLRRRFVDITHPDDAETDIYNAQRLATGEIGTYALEERFVRPDGSDVWVNLTASTVRNERGELLHFIAVVEDITARKEAQFEVQRAKAELQAHAANLERAVAERTARLEEVVKELGTFSYTVAHDLRAPLRTIRGFSDLVAEDYAAQLPEEGRAYLRRIGRAAERMERMISDVLEYSRVSRAELQIERIDTDALVREIVESLPVAQAHGHVEVRSPLPPVRASESALRQCFANLLGNALKHARPSVPPVIVVRAEPRGPTVRVWVEDNGVGIAPDQYERIWGLFERLDPKVEGSGVGLSIVRRAVERMGGRVGVESEPGVGSRFWLELPAG